MATVVALGSASALAGWALLRSRPSRVAIDGESMAPTLRAGDRAIVTTPRAFRRGDVVVVEHPDRPGYEMVKRLVGVPGDTVREVTLPGARYWVEGDFPQASTDSRSFGPVGRDALKAKVLLVYGPAGRRGVVR